MHNGDIIGILDDNLEQIVSYTYDSWGKLISVVDENGNEITDPANIGLINPYRYRGYRYDSETNLYYLQSRYYSSEWGRFLNADDASVLLVDQEHLIDKNLYTYSLNNPINREDNDGEISIKSAYNSYQEWQKDQEIKQRKQLAEHHVKCYLKVKPNATQKEIDAAYNMGYFTMYNSIEISMRIACGTATPKKAPTPVRMTSKEQTTAANKLGFAATNYFSNGQRIFKKGNLYISYDITGHNGGVWKMANSIKNLASASTRMGTYDAFLRWIGK